MSVESSADRSSPDRRLPAEIKQHDARTLAISWADGEKSMIDVRALRLACACAHCVDEWSGQALLAPDSVPADVAPLGLRSVGRYAIQIQWSDGHDTGIYPFERIRTLADAGDLTAPATKTAEGQTLLPTSSVSNSDRSNRDRDGDSE